MQARHCFAGGTILLKQCSKQKFPGHPSLAIMTERLTSRDLQLCGWTRTPPSSPSPNWCIPPPPLWQQKGYFVIKSARLLSVGCGLTSAVLCSQGPLNIDGATNYWLDIKSHSSDHPAARIWLLDSLEYGCNGQDGWCEPYLPCCLSLDCIAMTFITGTSSKSFPICGLSLMSQVCCAGAVLRRRQSNG